MRRWALQLVAVFAIHGASFSARGQIANPDSMVSGPPKPPPVRSKGHDRSLGKLQWVWQYTQPVPNGNAVALRADERFPSLLHAAFPQAQAFWGKNVPLAMAIPRFLERYGEVNTRENRYITVDGCVPSFCAAHGLLWMDLGLQEPLLIFAAVDWTTQAHNTDEASAEYNLWLFTSRQISTDALPLALTQAIADWDARLATAHRGVPHILHALLVEPSGQPYPLNPTLVGANTLPPQPDTATPKASDNE